LLHSAILEAGTSVVVVVGAIVVVVVLGASATLECPVMSIEAVRMMEAMVLGM
jgi:hypothetical protein